jgi:hypothetical protein
MLVKSPLLQLIYTNSLDTGEVPADWRTANVSPVYKTGLKSAAENYRPISLTSVCCKILEHIIARNIMQHAEENNIFSTEIRIFFQQHWESEYFFRKVKWSYPW